MFHKFFDFVGENDIKDSGSIQEFLEQCSGKSFLNGLYRIHFTADIPKWNDIVGRAFPKFANIIKVFGYDWLGRHFAIDSRNGTILLLEPGTGEVLSISVNFVDFHNTEIAEDLSISVNTVKSLKKAAYQTLRSLLAKDYWWIIFLNFYL